MSTLAECSIGPACEYAAYFAASQIYIYMRQSTSCVFSSLFARLYYFVFIGKRRAIFLRRWKWTRVFARFRKQVLAVRDKRDGSRFLLRKIRLFKLKELLASVRRIWKRTFCLDFEYAKWQKSIPSRYGQIYRSHRRLIDAWCRGKIVCKLIERANQRETLIHIKSLKNNCCETVKLAFY